ncbi:MAG: energy-coupling factor ABC transporter ATP-binding protein [Methanoregulaceae archaeon]|jgi:energy-coupling factor transport system ATP-binding protein|nr:energy-coupling factor ABC transporter ATP-binding protein [Methanoregulaceae archaeon]
MIEITALSYRALAIDHLTIGEGRTFLIGENGGGKTTLLRLLAGIDEPESGTVRIGGLPPRAVDTGWVNEYPDRNLLFPDVGNEIASPLRFRSTPCSEVTSRVKDISERLAIGYLLDRPVRDLSGGEKVLVAIAAALVHRPVLLLLDEYDSHLDYTSCRQIDGAITGAGSRYIIRCTQQMETAATGDQVILIHNGRVAASGSPPEVFTGRETSPFYPRSWRVPV